MDEILKRDQNYSTVLAAVTNDASQNITMLRVDPVTKRLLISGSFSSTSNPLLILSTTTGIDGKAVANTNLYTVPAGKTAIITGYVVRVSAATSITVGPAAGVGNASGTNNIASSQAMNALLTTADFFGWPIVGMSKTVTTGNSVFFNLGTGAMGTSETIVVDLMGYLV